MAQESPSGASQLLAAYARGEITGAELWDLLLAHADDPRADRLVDRVLARFRQLLEGSQDRPPLLIEDDLLVIADDDRELLAG